MIVNIHQAKTNFSRLVEEVEAGGEVIIGRSGRPVARLVAYAGDRTPRRPGRWAGRVTMADDFDATPAPLLDSFEGGR
jgi:prevent-host-death family protein